MKPRRDGQWENPGVHYEEGGNRKRAREGKKMTSAPRRKKQGDERRGKPGPKTENPQNVEPWSRYLSKTERTYNRENRRVGAGGGANRTLTKVSK